MIRTAFAVLCLLLMTSPGAWAHQSSTSFLHIQVAPASPPDYTAQWRASLIDVALAIGLDQNGDNAITWGEVLARHPAIVAYLQSRMTFQRQGQACRVTLDLPQLDGRQDIYLVQPMSLQCASTGTLDVQYSPLFDINTAHKGMIRFSTPQSHRIALVNDPQTHVSFAGTPRSAWQVFGDFVHSGMAHIAIGYDHLLFLLALLLPSVLHSHQGRWQVRRGFQPVLVDVLTIVTCFTLTHSLSLMAASQHWLTPSPVLVETVIAASVVVAGGLLFFPTFHRYRWVLALVFGFIHGFGFAGLLSEQSTGAEALWLVALGFNVGIEIGQILIVLMVLPLLYLTGGHRWYRRYCLPTGAMVLMVTGALWTLERWAV
ncbi:MAG TPA: hypothetical protein DD979_07940 [Gammaproteobacteria bacterium]|jgi:hypothetical protein|nr:hypothetical protein [Gammaproteobacteria bacterium]